MSPLNVKLGDLINQIDTELANADDLAKVSEAQLRSHTLADIGDQLVGHYVARARERGASWSQIGEAIGVSKQAAQQRWVPSMFLFERYTNRARHVIVSAQEKARANRNTEITLGHLLLGLLDEREGLAAKIVEETVGSIEALRKGIETSIPAGGDKSGKGGNMPMSSPAKEVLAEAARQAIELGHNFVGTEHLLLGLLVVAKTGSDTSLPNSFDLTYEVAREKVVQRVEAIVAERRNKS